MGTTREREGKRGLRSTREQARMTRATLRETKRRKALTLREVKARCAEQRREITARAKAARAALRDATRTARAEAKRYCGVRVQDATRADLERIGQLARKLDELRETAATYQAWCPGGACRLRRVEGRRESDDEVRRNLEPDMAVVFDRVKGRIRPTERQSRTEAFAQWAHDNSADVHRILADHYEREAEREWREYQSA